MNAWMPCFIGALGIVLLATAMPAAAKSINLPSLSPAAVSAACTRAGGAAYGTRDEGQPYGCVSRAGTVDCSPEGQCVGSVSDLRPLPASSLDAVLGAGVHAGPSKIGSKDARISPVVAR